MQYAINKSKNLLGFAGPDTEQHIVTELDSALNKWVDTVPSHCVSPSLRIVSYNSTETCVCGVWYSEMGP